MIPLNGYPTSDFIKSKSQATKLNVEAVMSTITANGIPFVLPCVHPLLHTSLTQACMIYSTSRYNRHVRKKDNISATISGYKLKTFKSLAHCQKSKPAIKVDLCKSLATARKNSDIIRVRGYDHQYVPKFDLIPSSYLFSEDKLITKPIRRTLIQKVLSAVIMSVPPIGSCVNLLLWLA